MHQQSEELYHILVAGVKEYAIFTLDSDGIVQTWNEGAKRLKGYVATEIIGKHYSVFYGADDQELKLPEAQLKNAITHGSDEDQGWRKRKDGSSFLADVVITPLFSATGELRGFTNITRDITDRNWQKELPTTGCVEAGSGDFDPPKTQSGSLKHDEIFGHHQQLQEWNFATFLLCPTNGPSSQRGFKLAIEKGQLRLQCRIIRANDKAVRWIAVRGETVWNKEGGATRLLGTIADITEVKEQHEQQRLLAIMQEREDFMATLTHDMKNPLIGANRLLELFVAGGLGDLTNQQKELLQCLKDSNASLLKLIANLIDIYRLDKDTNELFIQNCDLVNIVNCACRTLP
ncbi:MAG: PAS domain S-box protein [Candidatus Obscuribacter sp.]|nr:PAS domain S-box protein [Candidatus Obscuribacter sp.]